MYQYTQEHQSENPGIEEFLIAACKAELDVRMMSRQIRALKLAGFPTQKRFDDLVLEAFRKMEEMPSQNYRIWIS